MKKSEPYQKYDGNETTQPPQVSKSEFFEKVELSKEQRESIVNDLKACTNKSGYNYVLIVRSPGVFQRTQYLHLEALVLLCQGNLILSNLDYVNSFKYDPRNEFEKEEKQTKAEYFFDVACHHSNLSIKILEESLIAKGFDPECMKIFCSDKSLMVNINIDLKEIEKAKFFIMRTGLVKGDSFVKDDKGTIAAATDSIGQKIFRILAPGPFSKNNGLIDECHCLFDIMDE